jgi:hypothetical protein
LSKPDEHFRRSEDGCVEERQRHPQVVLHASASERTASRGLDRNRLVPERLIFQPRHPVQRILEPARNRPVVFRAHDNHAVRVADRIGEGDDVGGKADGLDIGIVKRHAVIGRRL